MGDFDIITTNQYLAFTLGEEKYAIEVSRVKEVLEFRTITRIPGTPTVMRGVMNVRGEIIPVLDLRERFGLKITENTVDTCILLIEVMSDNQIVTIGIIANSVEEVLEILPERIDPPPKFNNNMDIDFISGIGKLDERFLVILNSEKLIPTEDVNMVTESVVEV
ncbi:chemotaxis protein CheW [Marispirochaeta aestuarii]|uniref:chemotaxis protein CheW n=1 Tax=Marispirochaeta aestuarii TaxID=1963862 RepID=UPI0029C8C207|nr:chemotaxis protein CheW [Marispirochaeta aestuarii]